MGGAVGEGVAVGEVGVGRDDGQRGAAAGRDVAEPVDVEITPEPDEMERRAILEALGLRRRIASDRETRIADVETAKKKQARSAVAARSTSAVRPVGLTPPAAGSVRGNSPDAIARSTARSAPARRSRSSWR